MTNGVRLRRYIWLAQRNTFQIRPHRNSALTTAHFHRRTTSMSTFAITGTSRGIGLELVKQLAALPATQVSKIFAITRGPSEGLQQVIDASHDRVINIAIKDLSSDDSVQQGVEAVRKYSPFVDVLVNNAGIIDYNPGGMRSVKAADLQNVLNVDLVSAQVVTSAFLPLLEQGRDKKVINMWALSAVML